MTKKTLDDIQRGRYSRGAICYNTNNYQYCVVINGNRGLDTDPESTVLEISVSENGMMIHTPPNRALIPTGRFMNLDEIENMMMGG